MKNYFMLWLMLIFGCNGRPTSKADLKDSLANANDKIYEQAIVINNKQIIIDEFLRSFVEIQESLNNIKAREKLIVTSGSDPEMIKPAPKQIIADIQFIEAELNKSKRSLADVSNKLKNANLEIESLALAVTSLERQLTDKESEIGDLKSQISRMYKDFNTLGAMYYDEKKTSAQKTRELNEVLYITGTFRDLSDKGIITKEGGFIGLGKKTGLERNFDDSYFTTADLTLLHSIPLNKATKVTLVTPHPAGSYSFQKGVFYEKLLISDPVKFWKNSRHLVIITE